VSTTRVAVLGSTGSVGTQALSLLAEHADRFEVVCLQAHSRTAEFTAQVQRFRPRAACLSAASAPPPGWPPATRFHAGNDGVLDALAEAAPDVVLNAITGAAGLPASAWTLAHGLRLLLANKESMVLAGGWLQALARQHGATILPIDSEHCAIHQCLAGDQRRHVRRIWLTGSGGPFRSRPLETFAAITPAEALRHPTWTMGPRITIGSATMMNKAFEVIEAHWLFGLSAEQIAVVIHPQSIVHSMVEFVDGSMLAQCGVPDMRVPILYCLGWPDRLPSAFEPFDPARWSRLEFLPLEPARFPAVELAYEVLRRGGDSGALLNAADEELTRLFLAGAVPFSAITAVAAEVVRGRPPRPISGLGDVLAADSEGRRTALRIAADLHPASARNQAPTA
jgi:1-deoxy-D-xylulose-5-phosphate reductoisomerase